MKFLGCHCEKREREGERDQYIICEAIEMAEINSLPDQTAYCHSSCVVYFVSRKGFERASIELQVLSLSLCVLPNLLSIRKREKQTTNAT